MYKNLLNRFYDTAIDVNRHGHSIPIYGPGDAGDAMGELKKRLEPEGLNERFLVMEPIDRMNDHQIALKVREFLRRK